ncbi:MAG: hypothetical protein L6R38_009005 [Xanthoria sp. 2 TBL-2021]|nr:MAG: hypothetical protein L6R38_009005 [Xanthoria sp. 2 TBL-2021]
MSNKTHDERAVNLAAQAVELVASGRAEDGSRALREAASLAPDNPNVKAAFLKIQSDDSVHALQKLCVKFVLEQDEEAGKEALNYLDRSAQVPGNVATECLDLAIKERKIKSKDIQDGIVAGLLRESVVAKGALAKLLLDGSTAAFEQVYDIGDKSANSIAEIVLQPSAWSKQSNREKVEADVFQLFLAKLLAVGHDDDGRALKGIARLLATDAGRLHPFIDEEIFEAILCSLDYRQPAEVRSQATLATAKYLEISGEKGETYLARFIPSHITKGHGEDLVLAFSAAAAVFPLVPTQATALFLTEGFLPSLIPLLDRKIKNEKVEQAALNMLSAACLDSGCRAAIKKHCLPWLRLVMDKGKQDRPGLAAVILTKALYLTVPANDSSGNNAQEKTEVNSLVPMFKKLLADPREANKQSSIEGLAYASLQPTVKEELIDDRLFLARLMASLKASRPGATTIFGALTLIDHLTRYLPVLSEEQKKMNQLKAYASASKSDAKPDPLEEDAVVARRCKAVVEAGAVTTFVAISDHLSPASTAVVANIMLSLTRTPALRGTIAQQGGARLLLMKYTAITGLSDIDKQARRAVAHGLARILISIDPTLVFPAAGSPPLTSATRPILSLLTQNEAESLEGPRDLLPTFEALLALTNLASAPSDEATVVIIRQTLGIIEDLLLSNNAMIQRAATELVCNFMTSAAGIEIFADESKAADRRLHILLALADVEDSATRKAAGGALATLTCYEGVIKGIVAKERGMEILLGLCTDENHEIMHRGLVCINNIAQMQEPAFEQARKKLDDMDAVGILEDVANSSTNKVMKTMAAAIVGALQA